MKITFIGAAKTVTGSSHLLKINGIKILLDCGLYQGKRKESFELNRRFDLFHPADLDMLILSHAHIDHAGNIPNLVKHGFRGPVYCTFATKSLATIMLQDSAHIQEKDVEFVNKKRKKQGKNLFEPLYTQEDVLDALKLFRGVNYHTQINLTPDITLTFYDAGHILGSAITHLTIKEKGRNLSFGFSGDLGRPNLPIIRDPEKIPDVDLFICESTYGGRFHDSFTMSGDKMAGVVKSAIEKKGKIIVPAFSVGRTQEMLYLLNQLFDEQKIPRIPVYVDSPLSCNATQVFRMHPECFDKETADYLLRHKDPFGFNQLTYITDVQDSKDLNSVEGPCMIISSSGMAEAGRILHHLANNIENEKNTILIVGYCAEHTLGRKIVEKQSPLNILGDSYVLKANVAVFNSLSAHADGNELFDYCNNFDRNRLENVFLVHGDPDQQEKFQARLLASEFKSVTIPSRGESYEI